MIALFAVTEAGRRAAAEVRTAAGGELHPLDDLPALWPHPVSYTHLTLPTTPYV